MRKFLFCFIVLCYGSVLLAQNTKVQKQNVGKKATLNSPVPSREEWVATQIKNLQSIKDIPAEDLPGLIAAKEVEYDYIFGGGLQKTR